MIEILKKTLMAGAGLAHEAWEEVEARAKEIAKKAKMSENEGSKFLKDIKSRYDETQKKTGNYVEKVVKDILKKMDIATAADIKALKKEIRQLKKAVSGTSTKKSTRKSAAKKRAGRPTAKKRAGRPTAKKRTTTAAKKRTATATAKKRTATATAKKTARRANPKKR